MKVVINNCYGGFSVSRKAAEFMASLGCQHAKAEMEDWHQRQSWLVHFKLHGEWPDDCPLEKRGLLEISAEYGKEAHFYGYGYDAGHNGYDRTSEFLIKAIEELGAEANGRSAELKIVEIPDGTEFQIMEYDGNEWVAEKHKTWS
jgi:hypothetical protein